jgi:ribosomal-protein-alanine N-acetyltransferase
LRALSAAICTLEPQIVAHATEMFGVLSDPAIYEFENTPPVSEAWLKERFEKLETRQSADGAQKWLNWVIRLPSGELAGFVQATVLPTSTSYIAYELASKFWRRGIGSSAVRAVLQELASEYGVCTAVAILKARNFRSHALLCRLGFVAGASEQDVLFIAEQDEIVMVKDVGSASSAA